MIGKKSTAVAIVLLTGLAISSLAAQAQYKLRYSQSANSQQTTNRPAWNPGSSGFEAAHAGDPFLAMTRPAQRSASQSQRLQQNVNKIVAELTQANAARTEEEKQTARGILKDGEERLRKAVSERFDALMSDRDKQVDQLTARIKRLKASIQKSRDAKDQIVELRLKTLLNESKGLGFPSVDRRSF